MSQIDLFLGRCFAILGFCVKFRVSGAKQTSNLLHQSASSYTGVLLVREVRRELWLLGSFPQPQAHSDFWNVSFVTTSLCLRNREDILWFYSSMSSEILAVRVL